MTSAYKLVFGVLGNITALSLLGSPTKTFWGIIRVKKVGDFSGDPYVTALVNTLLWVVYGSPSVKLQVLVLTINTTGAALEFLYIVIYCVYAPRERRLAILELWNGHLVAPSPFQSFKVYNRFRTHTNGTHMRVAKLFAMGILGFILSTALFLGLDRNQEHRIIFFGILCGLFCTIMYAAPLTIMMMVIKTKSVEYMPFLLSLFVFLNGIVWFAYAIMPEMDIFIAVPNGLGMLLGGGQLILYGMYFRSTPRMQHVGPQEYLAAMTVSNQPKNFKSEVIREGTEEGVQNGFAKESKEGAQGQVQTQRKITAPENV